MFNFNKNNKTPRFSMVMPSEAIINTPEVKQPGFFSLGKKQKGPFKIKIHGNTEMEQALYMFRNVKFYDKLKFLLYRATTSTEPANILLAGPKGTAKSALADIIAEACYDVLYVNAKTTIAGLIEQLQENPNIRIIIFDEADKILDKGEKDDIRGFLASGRLTRTTKAGGHIEIEIKNLITILTANNVEKFDGPFLSRFTRFYLPEYTDEQFKEICTFRMPEYNPEMIEEIAQHLLDNKMKDVRNMVKLRSYIKPTDSLEIVEMVLSTIVEFETTTTKNTNWDKK